MPLIPVVGVLTPMLQKCDNLKFCIDTGPSFFADQTAQHVFGSQDFIKTQ